MARRSSTGSARVVFGSLGAATRSTPSRRNDQMHFAYVVVSGVISPHCDEAKRPKCSICAKEHATRDQRCSVEGCRVGRGRMCPHMTAKRANCGGPHGARADACAAKKIAQHAARGWRPPSPSQRERRDAPGVTALAVKEEGELEAEEVAEPEVEGMEEQRFGFVCLFV